MNRKTTTALLLCLSVNMISVMADVILAPIFSDNMVLQESTLAPIWGTAEPNENIIVSATWGLQDCRAQTGKDGKWMVKVKTPHSGGPYEITIKAANTIVLKDVLIGQVWLCSGQSNMFMPVGGIEWAPDGVENADQVLSKPKQPMLRLFCDDGHQLWKGAKWQVAAPDTIKPFSATAYFFGVKLLEELNVPIGLINISRGGSPIQQWTPKEYNDKVPVTKKYSDLFTQHREQIDAYNKAFNAYYEAAKSKSQTLPKPQLPQPLPDDINAARGFYGCVLYDNLIAPIVPFAIRGVIWYQGEANAAHPEIAMHYDDMLNALISAWRDKWQQSDMPFYFVQLPGWDNKQYAQNWVWVRQSMLNVCQTTTNTGMAVTIDAGDPKDIHPMRKKPVGERLALLALAKTYGKLCVYSGPLPIAVSNDGKDLRIRFDTFGSSLKLLNDKFNDLEVAGNDGVFYPATGEITQTDAIVSCPQVIAPAALRYGWQCYFQPTLLNTEDIPASPFYFIRQTDEKWYLATAANVNVK